MIKNRYAFIYTVIVLLIFSLACSISATPKKEATPVASNLSAAQPQSVPQNQPQTQPQIIAAPTTAPLPVTPVGLNKGLASLNSYTYTMQVITLGPTPQDKNDMKIITSFTSNGDNTKTQNISVSSSADDPKENRSSTTNYRVGNVTCTVDDNGESDPEIDDYSAAQKEILNIGMNLVDTVINVENPVSVGTETINGINCNHFTFTVVGLGKTSGAEVTQSTGEYWSAVDGNYLVKYDVSLETRNAPESNANAEVLHTEMHFLLSDVNAPINIELPAACKKV
jgi:hypothetical protein